MVYLSLKDMFLSYHHFEVFSILIRITHCNFIACSEINFMIIASKNYLFFSETAAGGVL